MVHAFANEYPPADPGRVAEAERLFPYRGMTPEEYAAREGRNWMCFSFDDFVYPSAELSGWLHVLGDILHPFRRPPGTIFLQSESFVLHGKAIGVGDWCEFGALIGDDYFPAIGGDSCARFVNNFAHILGENRGTPLAAMKDPHFADMVEKADVEYIGHLVFSGYETLYFFVDLQGLRKVVLANNAGAMRAHAELRPELAERWLASLCRMRESFPSSSISNTS